MEILCREEGFVDRSDKDKETKSAGQDFRERSTVGTIMETLGHRFTAKVAAIETFGKKCGKQHFCASTELFSSRLPEDPYSALWTLLELSVSFSSPFESTNPSSLSSISATVRPLDFNQRLSGVYLDQPFSRAI